ncbi:MAG TPA: L-seryl-tRNA(Sec) selenium transferase [Candidatus Acidoferrales bacterium]|nr:L-seryl-tRNA(Sec) selenium transferase [Candidatus Acidoferrales bacterium]
MARTLPSDPGGPLAAAEKPSKPPAVATVLRTPELQSLRSIYPHRLIVEAVREQLKQERGGSREPTGRLEAIRSSLSEATSPRLLPVINATGVVLHTNLGRAPLSPRAVQALVSIAGRYSNVELDLESGKRGDRQTLVQDLLCRLSGAEAAMAVNNNAAAVLLALQSLARNREVIISRGQQVEIGGSFRMPDVMKLSGSRMVEVGTTNRTRAADYEAAITGRTAALLRVHTSNFNVVGFTETTSLRDMADIANRHGLLLIDDLGSGAMVAGSEPAVAESVGVADVTTFSGDKLLGGPQAGVVLGRLVAIRRMERSPLARAVRVDKMTLAALEATLLDHLLGSETPVARMQGMGVDEIRRRSNVLRSELNQHGIESSELPATSVMGGGSLPGNQMPTVLLALAGAATALATRLRRGRPAVLCRIQDGRCCIDLRTVLPNEENQLLEAILAAARSAPNHRRCEPA